MTTENNKIIAEFMGAKEIITETTHRIYKEFEMYGIIESIEDREDIKHFYQHEEMLFNSDWNWLMEVVSKVFEKEEFIKDDLIFKLNDTLLECNKDSLYLAVFNCVKWYNEQKKV